MPSFKKAIKYQTMMRGIVVLLLLSCLQALVHATSYYVPNGPCYIDACKTAECPAQRGAKCISLYDGCVARFYDKYGNDVTENCQCPKNVKPRRCIRDPCDRATCSKMGQCRTDTCGGCDPVFYNRNAKPIIGCPEDPGCPDGKEINCLINACQYPNCPSHVNAKCRTTCNGCVAHYFDKFDNEVKCDCPGGQLVESNCRRNLCKNKVCHGYPDAECRISKCGGCHTEFYDKMGRQMTCGKPPLDVACPPPDPEILEKLPVMFCPAPVCYNNADCKGNDLCCSDGCSQRCISPPFVDPRCPSNDGAVGICINLCRSNLDCVDKDQICCKNGCGTMCKNKPLDSGCPDGKEINCLINACQYPNCPSHVNAKCKTTCNGCVAHYFDKFDHEVKCDCPSGQLVESNCRRNLCKNKVCHGYPDAECRISKCGGCHTEFYDKKGRQVICGKPPLDVACPPPDPKILKKLPFMLCPAPVCYSNADCKGNDLCCSDGCSQRCISSPFVDPRCPSNDGVVGPCINLCRSNLDCVDKNQICCKNGCGTMCKNKPLDERCPPPDPKILDMLPFITCPTGSCKSNSDCKGKKICCNNGCSNQCVNPPGYDERCPLSVAPVSLIPCPPKVCSSNSDCRSDYMCCGLFCGSHCTPKARTCEPGEYLAKCRNMCKFSKCRKYPGAKCRVHGCNGCKVEFYDGFTNRRYNDCNDIDLPPFA